MPKYIVREKTEIEFEVMAKTADDAIEAVAERSPVVTYITMPRTSHTVREVPTSIPKSEYISMSGVGNVITNELLAKYHSPKEMESFFKWMRGQTCTTLNGKVAYYSWDYERWLSQGKKTVQGDDWD